MAKTQYYSNSSISLSQFVDVQSPERDAQIARVAIELCPQFWNPSDQEEEKKDENVTSSLEVKTLTGGLSNELFIVHRQNDSSSSVLVRIHPDAGDKEGMIDRDIENNLAAWLAKQGLAPAYYGRFENGRIEEFYQNVTPLSSATMSKYASQIAKIMATFHNLQAPDTVLPKPTKKEASIYETIDSWLQKALLLEVRLPNDNMEFLKLLETEWEWLFAKLQETSAKDAVEEKALSFIREIVVAHMDCQSLNFLKDEKDEVRVIDFEYAGWNPRAADVANTFCEYCDMNNICADYEKEYPSDQQQDEYLTSYIRTARLSVAKQLDADGQWSEFLAPIRREIGRFSLVSHLGWAVWSVIKSKENTEIDFDYIKYAHHRIDGYNFAKAKFFQTEQR